VAALTSMLAPSAGAKESLERHGLSAFGDLKYPPLCEAMSSQRPAS
jgi:hypothetical protein